jgi:hypothetical protein
MQTFLAPGELMKKLPLSSHLIFFAVGIMLVFMWGSQTAAQPSAPVPISPANGSSIIIPTFSWQTTTGADHYQVQVSTDSAFNTIPWDGLTRNIKITPQLATSLANGPFYWRVRAYNAANQAGSWSSIISFTKYIPAPVLSYPTGGSSIVHPSLEWGQAEGAALFRVELSSSPTFVPLNHTYLTYNLSLTPPAAIEQGLTYWRVFGKDAGNHDGTSSAVSTFTKTIPAPLLVSPVDSSSLTQPTLVWEKANGVAYYRIQFSTSPDFNPLYRNYRTANIRLTPQLAFAPGTYYWRVIGEDPSGHQGDTSLIRSFTLTTPPAATDDDPQLLAPSNGATITTDPTFQWTRSLNADHYTLQVSKNDTFSPLFEEITSIDYPEFSPYEGAGVVVYPDGTYYWKVQAKTAGGAVLGTSGVRTFTKQSSLLLLAPLQGALLTTNPTFQWEALLGADHYRLLVSANDVFSPTYDTVVTDYLGYTPFDAPGLSTYVDGSYYWKMEAKTSAGTTITTSTTRQFAKQMSLTLSAPANGAVLDSDPTFQWQPLVGVDHYRLLVSTQPDFSPNYDSLNVDYPIYTPYDAAGLPSYAKGTYYWKIEGRTSLGTIITTSATWIFHKGEVHTYLPLIRKK